MDLNEVFTPERGKPSPYTDRLTPYFITPGTSERINRAVWESGLSKSEIVRYCLESMLETVDWKEVAELKKVHYANR